MTLNLTKVGSATSTTASEIPAFDPISDRDILTAISALEASISSLGYTNFTFGAGVKAAIEALN